MTKTKPCPALFRLTHLRDIHCSATITLSGRIASYNNQTTGGHTSSDPVSISVLPRVMNLTLFWSDYVSQKPGDFAKISITI